MESTWTARTLANPFMLVAVGAAPSLQAAGVSPRRRLSAPTSLCADVSPRRRLSRPPVRDLLGAEPLPLTDLAIPRVLSGLGHVVMRLPVRLRPERPPRADLPAMPGR
ncbi:hypothetical protein [Streptomyces blattellae]|uniref:hypothetical protein n=1 Tax=Streptomyces blattellae TaxID=2569855 RepID=UPI001E461B12|nr:hypothetical protein [Streptomyces blattellae]